MEAICSGECEREAKGEKRERAAEWQRRERCHCNRTRTVRSLSHMCSLSLLPLLLSHRGTNQPADKTDMPSSLYRWLESELRLSDPNDKRGLLVITHHQPNSAFDEPYLLPAKGIADRLPKERKFLWLYGN